jgi:hypothetical protein
MSKNQKIPLADKRNLQRYEHPKAAETQFTKNTNLLEHTCQDKCNFREIEAARMLFNKATEHLEPETATNNRSRGSQNTRGRIFLRMRLVTQREHSMQEG